MLKRLMLALSLAAMVAGLTQVVGGPEVAQAYSLDSYYRFKYGKICVIDHTGWRWPVYSATYRWTRVPDLSLKYENDCYGRYWWQKIHVYASYEGYNGSYGHAYAKLYSKDGDYEKLSDGSWREYRCVIQMNNTYGAKLSRANRRSALMHEMGHCSALKHTSSYALMNIYRWKRYDSPTRDDKRGVNARYPW